MHKHCCHQPATVVMFTCSSVAKTPPGDSQATRIRHARRRLASGTPPDGSHQIRTEKARISDSCRLASRTPVSWPLASWTLASWTLASWALASWTLASPGTRASGRRASGSWVFGTRASGRRASGSWVLGTRPTLAAPVDCRGGGDRLDRTN